MKEAIYRHYYKKLKKILRGKAIPQYNDFSPGDLLFRGQARAQTDELLKSGATKSNGSGVVSSLGDKDKTYATTRLKLAGVFAGRGAAFTKTPDGFKRHAGEIVSFVKQKDPGYQQARKRLGSFRDTSKPSMRQGSINDDVLALRNPIMKDELRGILVKQGGAKHGYRPLTLREAKERGFSAKLRLREFSALRKRVRVKWHSDGSARMTIPNAYGGVNEIGRIETSVSSQRAANVGQVKWVEVDPRFRGMGLATKMYGEAMKGAPRGRLVSDNTQYGGGYGVWNKLQRNKGYKVRENPKIDGAGFDELISRDGRPMFIGRISPAARKQSNLSAKLRLRELAYGRGL